MLLRHQVSEERDEHIDMTPMVDVVFQLMTFMLFSVQLSGSEVNVPTARHGVGVEQEAATFLVMLPPAVPGEEPRVVIGLEGKQAASVEELRGTIQQGI